MPDNSFTVLGSDLRRIRRIDDGAATAPLDTGEVRLRVGPFSLTANNVTYGLLGRSFGYFAFYPAGDEGEGRIPVWGFADVVESNVPDVNRGERFYGYYPISTHVILKPTKVAATGFLDGSPHRKQLPPIYNRYANTAADPSYSREREGEISLFRPLFATAFLLDDFFEEESFFGAESIVMSSASSKTAYATAYFLAARRAAGGPKLVGLTSPRNQDFARGLGVYDEVRLYDELETLPQAPAAYVDFSGDAALRGRVHAHYGDRLKHSAIVGSTHWDARQAGSPELPGSATLFSAPSRAQKRTEDWGTQELLSRIGKTFGPFIERATDPKAPWIQVVTGTGLEAAIGTYEALLEGRVGAQEGRVISI
jgi:hypothetical protein